MSTSNLALVLGLLWAGTMLAGWTVVCLGWSA